LRTTPAPPFLELVAVAGPLLTTYCAAGTHTSTPYLSATPLTHCAVLCMCLHPRSSTTTTTSPRSRSSPADLRRVQRLQAVKVTCTSNQIASAFALGCPTAKAAPPVQSGGALLFAYTTPRCSTDGQPNTWVHVRGYTYACYFLPCRVTFMKHTFIINYNIPTRHLRFYRKYKWEYYHNVIMNWNFPSFGYSLSNQNTRNILK